jgi:hypothetical protein
MKTNLYVLAKPQTCPKKQDHFKVHIHDYKVNRLDELQPCNWVRLASVTDSQAA